MGRIRTIKPEFPQSESVGKLSRDARLLFIQLWTLSDDEGRGRAAIPVLAGALYPYDEDARLLLPVWLDELAGMKFVLLYQAGGNSYFQICSWSDHQKIDRPSPSRFPAPDGSLLVATTEKDIELSIFGALKTSKVFNGEAVIDVQRQVRVGSSYLDVVVKTPSRTFVLEVKKGALSGADIAQVKRYGELIGGVAVLIGSGLSAKLSSDECRASGVAIALHDDDGVSLLYPFGDVQECSITFASVIECSSTDLGPRTSTKDQDHSRSIEADQPAPAKPQKPKSEDPPSRFDDFWKAYPRRDGPSPRKPAEQKFNALVKSGCDPEMLIAEAKKLASAEAARGNVGTRFIPMAQTWLGQQRWSDHAAVAALAEMSGADYPIEQAVQMFAKIGHWSRYAGPEPGHTGCKASPELLAQYGIAPDGRKLAMAS